MNKKIMMLLLILIMFIPSVAFAEGYRNLSIKSVFATKANVSNIDSVYVQFEVYFANGKEKKSVTLTRDNNFESYLNFNVLVDDVKFLYGYCITNDGYVDSYGFLTVNGGVTKDPTTSFIDLVLSIDYDSMGFDGQNYRSNIDYTNEDIANRKNGQPVEVPNTEVGVVDHYKDDAVAPNIDENLNIIEKTSPIDYQNNNKESEEIQKKEEEVKRVKTTLIIVGIIFGIVFVIFIIVTMIKMYQAKKRV